MLLGTEWGGLQGVAQLSRQSCLLRRQWRWHLRQSQRCFPSTRYKRLMWRPSFPSDLPPALRQGAQVLEYTAPEVTPHKKTWTIHAHSRLRDIAQELCRKNAVHELLANVVFHALIAINCQDPRVASRREANFRNDFFTTCSNLFEVHHVHSGAEAIFAVLNPATLAEVSPEMRSNVRPLLRELVVDSMETWIYHHQDCLQNINVPYMFKLLGPEAYFKLVLRLNFSLKALRGEDIDILLYHLTTEARDLFGVIRSGLLLCPVDSIDSWLCGTTPSAWTLRRVLGYIEHRHSEHALRTFLGNLEPHLWQEALQALRERDWDTGLPRDEWSFATSLVLEQDARSGKLITDAARPVQDPTLQLRPRVQSLSKASDAVDTFEVRRFDQRMYLTDGELQHFAVRRRRPRPLSSLAPESALRDSPWPQGVFDVDMVLAVDKGEAPPTTALDAYYSNDVPREENVWTAGADSRLPMVIPEVVSRAEEAGGLPSIDAPLPIDCIHFIDTAQSLSHVLTYFKELPPRFVAVDLEWSDPFPVSLIQLATTSRVFLLDTVNKTSLYMSVLRLLMSWLLKNESCTKLFFGFPEDFTRLNVLFGATVIDEEGRGRLFKGADHIASVLDLNAARIRRVQAIMHDERDTPLGRESLLGEAIQAEDHEEVQRLSEAEPELASEGKIVEQTFTTGGHSSLNVMVLVHLGLKLDKSLQDSNWNFRPLSAAQIIYSAVDAHVLLRLEAALRMKGSYPRRVFGAAPRGRDQPAWWDVKSSQAESP